MSIKLEDVKSAILAGDFDDDLRELSELLKYRKEQAAKKLMFSLQEGDHVIVDNIRPKAICGCTATVVKVNRTRISVNFEPGSVPPRYAGACTVPAACCTKVE